MRTAARENRAFLGRAVRFLAGGAGIRQFLDISTGLPTSNNVHEIAQAAEPSARVVAGRVCRPSSAPARAVSRRRSIMNSSPDAGTGSAPVQ